MEIPKHPAFSWTVTRIIFSLLSAVGVLIGIEYSSIRSEAAGTAADLAALRHSMAQMETRQQVAEERTKHADDGFLEIQHRLEAIDARLAGIGEEVAVLADRSVRSSSARSLPLRGSGDTAAAPQSP
jgi:chromosome segregation ATPase